MTDVQEHRAVRVGTRAHGWRRHGAGVPVDAATSTTITSVKGDIVAWGVGVHRGGADDLRVQARQVVGAVVRAMGGGLCTGCRSV